MNKNAPDHIVQLKTPCDRAGDLNALARQAPRDSKPVHGQSNTYRRLLEQLEAENRQLRAEAVDLVLQIYALRNGISALTIQPTGAVDDLTRADSCAMAEGQPTVKTQAKQSVIVYPWRNRGP
jgi:hypothetical protein